MQIHSAAWSVPTVGKKAGGVSVLLGPLRAGAIWVTPLGWKAPLFLHCGTDVAILPTWPTGGRNPVCYESGSSLYPSSSGVKQGNNRAHPGGLTQGSNKYL